MPLQEMKVTCSVLENTQNGTDSSEIRKNSSHKEKARDKQIISMKKKDSIDKETLPLESQIPKTGERCESQMSSSVDLCRICQCETSEILPESPLISPCLCDGSLRFIHQACLQKWIKSSNKTACELCNFDYLMTKKTKPFSQWERLEMSTAERRKVVCSVTFHVIAITCVVWSLFVLIDRTKEEVEEGALEWPFWTKLIVVAIGFTGGVAFMYVQCKMYFTLCKKWQAYNKIVLIDSISDVERATIAVQMKKAQVDGGVTNIAVIDDMDII